MKHTITITRTTTSGGGFGVDPTETTTTIYSGRCDVQDLSYEVKRSLSGEAELDADARVFFPRRKFPVLTKVDDGVSATFEGVTLAGRVVDLDRLDASVVVKWQS